MERRCSNTKLKTAGRKNRQILFIDEVYTVFEPAKIRARNAILMTSSIRRFRSNSNSKSDFYVVRTHYIDRSDRNCCWRAATEKLTSIGVH